MAIYPATTENIKKAAKILQTGNLVAMPTETVYGLAADALNPAAIKKIYALKKRPVTNPLIVHLHSAEQIEELTEANKQQIKTLERLKIFIPGALTVILPKSKKVPLDTTAGNQSIAIRIPSHPVAQELLKTVNLPLAAPSANLSTKVSPTSARHVLDEFGEDLFILDGGSSELGLESTVLSLLEDIPKILRPGIITLEMLQEVLGQVSFTTTTSTHSPGQMNLHYSPKTKLAFKKDISEITNLKTGYISFSKQENTSYVKHICLSENSDLQQVSAGLYAALREMDNAGLDLILVDDCEEKGIGKAIIDRLKRAIG